MTFGQFINMILARWKMVALIVGGVTLATFVVSLMMPKQYIATSSLVFDQRPDPVTKQGYDSYGWPSYLATQVQILESDRVADRVATSLGLKTNPAVRQRWEKAGAVGDFNVWLIGELKKATDIRLARETSVVEVAFKAPDSQFAAKASNAFVKAYLETVIGIRVDPAKEYTTFFETRAKELREQLQAAQSKLSEHQRQAGIVVTDENLDVEVKRLADLSAQLVLLQTAAAESTGRQSAAARNVDQLPDVQANPVVAGLKADLMRQEAKLQEMSSRLGDAHPQLIEARANVNALRARLDAESRRVAGSVGVTNTINRAREGEIKAAYEQQHQRVVKLKSARDQAQVYQREVDNAQKALDAITTQANQSVLESRATQSNASILTQATPPLLPSSPRIVLNTLVAAFVSSLIAAGLAVVLESINRRVRSADDITEVLGLPVIGALPEAARLPSSGPRVERSVLAQRVLGQLPMSRS